LVLPFESSMQVPQKIKTELPYDLLLGIYPEKKKKKTLIPTDTCTPMFTVICSNPTTVFMLL